MIALIFRQLHRVKAVERHLEGVAEEGGQRWTPSPPSTLPECVTWSTWRVAHVIRHEIQIFHFYMVKFGGRLRMPGSFIQRCFQKGHPPIPHQVCGFWIRNGGSLNDKLARNCQFAFLSSSWGSDLSFLGAAQSGLRIPAVLIRLRWSPGIEWNTE